MDKEMEILLGKLLSKEEMEILKKIIESSGVFDEKNGVKCSK